MFSDSLSPFTPSPDESVACLPPVPMKGRRRWKQLIGGDETGWQRWDHTLGQWGSHCEFSHGRWQSSSLRQQQGHQEIFSFSVRDSGSQSGSRVLLLHLSVCQRMLAWLVRKYVYWSFLQNRSDRSLLPFFQVSIRETWNRKKRVQQTDGWILQHPKC